jgi:hypothetical protein
LFVRKIPMISRKICAGRHVGGTFSKGRAIYLFLSLLGVLDNALADASKTSQVLFLGTPSELPRARVALARGALKGPGDRGGESHATWLLGDGWPPDSSLNPEDLAPLRRVEALLLEARRSAAELDEGAALDRLAEAQRLAWDSLSVPGAAAFCAEVELQLAVTAAQAGRLELAADSLARAARLDGPRKLLAAEASPEVVALASRVFLEAATGPEGELPISTDAERARMYVDDIDRGLAPQRVRVRVGTHALRIEAPGRLPYHARIEVAAGVRPPQHFVLAPDPRALAVARVREVRRADATTLADATYALLSAAPDLGSVVWIDRDERTRRELVHTCDETGCTEPVRLDRGRLDRVERDVRLTPETLRAARAWLRGDTELDAARAVSSETPWWMRWYVWSAVAALAIGGGAVFAVALEPEPTRTLRVVVDSGDLR